MFSGTLKELASATSCPNLLAEIARSRTQPGHQTEASSLLLTPAVKRTAVKAYPQADCSCLIKPQLGT